MKDEVFGEVESRDRPWWVDAGGEGVRAVDRAGGIERDEGGLVVTLGKGQPRGAQGQAKRQHDIPPGCGAELCRS
jgi:hypothetical protein